MKKMTVADCIAGVCWRTDLPATLLDEVFHNRSGFRYDTHFPFGIGVLDYR